MNNKIKIIITIVSSALIIGIGMFFIYSNKQTLGNKKSKEFIKAISYIKEEKYVDAYNVIKNGKVRIQQGFLRRKRIRKSFCMLWGYT